MKTPVDPKRVIAVIPSAGVGQRLGKVKKNLIELAGRPVLAHTLGAFEESRLVSSVVVAGAPGDEERIRKEVIEKYAIKKVRAVIPGGAERQDSVYCALKWIKDSDEGFDLIVVHDGARPLVTPGLIDETIEAAAETGAAITAVRPKDTIKEVQGSLVKRTLPRDSLIAVQTPQAFGAELLIKAYEAAAQAAGSKGAAEAAGFRGTDCSSLVERFGSCPGGSNTKVSIVVVPGSYENIKITTSEDLPVAEAILKKRGEDA